MTLPQLRALQTLHAQPLTTTEISERIDLSPVVTRSLLGALYRNDMVCPVGGRWQATERGIERLEPTVRGRAA